MKQIFSIFVILLLASSLQAGTIYKWVDKEGVVHFTDDLTQVPPSYRDRVEEEKSKDVQEEVPPPSPQAITPRVKDEVKTDIFGRDETWWQDKVRPWKQQLKEATENLEKAREKFAEKTVEMGRKGLVSRARYQTEANKFDEEKAKYEAQIAEAKEMLEKLRKEAEDSKADPDWLR